MERDQIMQVVRDAFAGIAPEIDVDRLDPFAELQTEADIDSMDFLNVVTVIDRELGIEVPERDYPLIGTLDALLRYLAERTPATR